MKIKLSDKAKKLRIKLKKSSSIKERIEKMDRGKLARYE
jgi:hypothetical protein